MSFAQGRHVLVTLAVFAIFARAQETKVELTGKVTEPATGLGIPGAQVTLLRSGGIETPGRWVAKVQADGYVSPSIFNDSVAVDVLPRRDLRRARN